jgi:hypothetical protein
VPADCVKTLWIQRAHSMAAEPFGPDAGLVALCPGDRRSSRLRVWHRRYSVWISPETA